MFITISEPSDGGAPIGAASSSLNVLRKRATCATQPKGQKCQIKISKILLVPHNSTTSLGFSKRGLPAPSAAKIRGTVKRTADNNWVRSQFVNFQRIEKYICDSGARVEIEEAIDDELQKANSL